MSYSYIIKSLLIGDEGVGRSSLSRKFVTGSFERKRPDSGLVGFIAKRMSIDDKEVLLHIYKTSNEKHLGKAVNNSYYRFVIGGILVYDTTRRETFNNIPKWLEEVREERFAETSLILIGNKCDLESDRAVSYDEGESFARKNGLFFFETSAKSGENVDNVFQKMIDIIHEEIKSGVIVTDKKSIGLVIAGFRSEPSYAQLQEKKKGFGCGECACW